MSLAPEHLDDLHKSGLTDSTIATCRFESVPPHNLHGLKGIESAYSLPYHAIDGTLTDTQRWKLFPPLQRPDGKQKYYQAPGSSPALYFPPLCSWAEIAHDHFRPIHITEGEKKAAALSQGGIPTIGVAGVWNWRQRLDKGDRLVIPSVDQFAWKDREVVLVPDSDVWRKDKLQALCGFYALGQELVSRGANVCFVVLPETGQGKVGIDDWLVKNGPQWKDYWPC